MSILSSIVGFIAFASSLFAPVSAMAAIGTSFGGRIIDIHPCGGGIQITVLPAGVFQTFYVYSVGSIGLPPTHIGQYILGIADAPILGLGGCLGQRIQRDGVSL